MDKLDLATMKVPMNVTVVRDEAGIEELIAWIKVNQEFGFDLETSPLATFFARKCRLIQFGNKEKQYVVDLLALCDNDPASLLDAQGNYGERLHKYPKLAKFIAAIKLFLESGLWLKVGVNLWFEFVTMYWAFGVRMWHLFDCQLAERVIWAGAHSLKDYAFYSMHDMMERYFGIEIDKSLQESFDVSNVLTEDQYTYAALDTRFPLALKVKQLAAGAKAGLIRTFRIENDAVGIFAEMTVHGERLDVTRWKKNTQDAIDKLNAALSQLDECFMPFVGNKNVEVTDEDIATAIAAWKVYNEITAQELALKAQIKAANKAKDAAGAALLEKATEALITERKSKKEVLKKKASELGKLRTRLNKLKPKCEGQALINYGSGAQILAVLVEHFPQLRKLDSTDEDDLKQFEGIPVIDALREYREWGKRVGTYGDSWTTEWTTKPGGEEGWLSPYTHRLHPMYSQLGAETGRGSSDNPNGQNLPGDKEVRECFIADEGYVYVTCDMAGAELRIIAELANAKTWIDAFARGEDVHSICTEILFPKEWEANQCKGEEVKIKGKMVPYWCEYYKLHTEETLKKYPKGTLGQAMRQKCECPAHKTRRNTTKALNFGLAYGAVATTISRKDRIPLREVEQAIALHEQRFADVWKYLLASGLKAKNENQAFDMYGRRRLLPKPTDERARQRVIDDYPETLEYEADIKAANIAAFIATNGRKPTKEEKFWLTHKQPTSRQIQRAFISISRGIERAGKNHCVQGTNASIAKLALGSGFDKNGKGYLFHILPLYGAKIIKFIHDEIVVQCLPGVAEQVAAEIADAFKRAAAEVMTKVIMEAEFKISTKWEK